MTQVASQLQLQAEFTQWEGLVRDWRGEREKSGHVSPLLPKVLAVAMFLCSPLSQQAAPAPMALALPRLRHTVIALLSLEAQGYIFLLSLQKITTN